MTVARKVDIAVLAPVLAAALAFTTPVVAFEQRVLDSAVSVLPEWPTGQVSREVNYARRMRPEGTGTVLLPGGLIATNAHVIGGAVTVRVRLRDGRILPAEIVGVDADTDLALVRAPVNLPPLTAGPEPAIGEPVCAVGNPFGLDLSVTCGVVSAIHRTGTGFNPIEDFIQTDAVVNPGGSGGPLVDDEGRLVGLVSAIFNKEVDANIGVNFAASAALVMRVAEDLARHGRVIRGSLGIQLRKTADADLVTVVGARVVSINAGSPAGAAGLLPGDIIRRVAGRDIRKASDVVSAVQLHPVGATLELEIDRAGTAHRLTVTLGE